MSNPGDDGKDGAVMGVKDGNRVTVKGEWAGAETKGARS